jgi:hypothetical protein
VQNKKRKLEEEKEKGRKSERRGREEMKKVE